MVKIASAEGGTAETLGARPVQRPFFDVPFAARADTTERRVLRDGGS